jgi:hypothetical protein
VLEVHVHPVDRTATWLVRDTEAAAPCSEYETQTAAESAARVHAERQGAKRIVVHDRYHRTRELTR